MTKSKNSKSESNFLPRVKRPSVQPITINRNEKLKKQRLLAMVKTEEKEIRKDRRLDINMRKCMGINMPKHHFVALLRAYRLRRRNLVSIEKRVLDGDFKAVKEILTHEEAVKKVKVRRGRRRHLGQPGTSNERHVSPSEDSEAFHKDETDPDNLLKRQLEDEKDQPNNDEGAGTSDTQNQRNEEEKDQDSSEERMRKRCGTNVTENTYLDSESSKSSPVKRQRDGSENVVELKDNCVELSDINPVFVSRENDGYRNEAMSEELRNDDTPISNQPQRQESNYSNLQFRPEAANTERNVQEAPASESVGNENPNVHQEAPAAGNACCCIRGFRAFWDCFLKNVCCCIILYRGPNPSPAVSYHVPRQVPTRETNPESPHNSTGEQVPSVNINLPTASGSQPAGTAANEDTT